MEYKARMEQIAQGQTTERVSGFPMPELYNQHYINKYSFPKGLIAGRKTNETTDDKPPRQSIYDMYAQPVRKGVSGWKLTKRMVSTDYP